MPTGEEWEELKEKVELVETNIIPILDNIMLIPGIRHDKLADFTVGIGRMPRLHEIQDKYRDIQSLQQAFHELEANELAAQLLMTDEQDPAKTIPAITTANPNDLKTQPIVRLPLPDDTEESAKKEKEATRKRQVPGEQTLERSRNYFEKICLPRIREFNEMLKRIAQEYEGLQRRIEIWHYQVTERRCIKNLMEQGVDLDTFLEEKLSGDDGADSSSSK